MTKPLPCPFCGSDRVSVREGSTFRWRIAGCDDCGAQAGEVRARTLGPETKEEREAEAREDAIKAWNERAVGSAEDKG